MLKKRYFRILDLSFDRDNSNLCSKSTSHQDHRKLILCINICLVGINLGLARIQHVYASVFVNSWLY